MQRRKLKTGQETRRFKSLAQGPTAELRVQSKLIPDSSRQVAINYPEDWLERCWPGWAADVLFPSVCPALDLICSKMECWGQENTWAQHPCCLLSTCAQGSLLLEAGLFCPDKRMVTEKKKKRAASSQGEPKLWLLGPLMFMWISSTRF